MKIYDFITFKKFVLLPYLIQLLPKQINDFGDF